MGESERDRVKMRNELKESEYTFSICKVSCYM